MTILSLDVESRSTVDLKKTGAYVYWEHKTTDLWCACYAFGDQPVQTWLPGQPCPPAIAAHVASGGMISAWNAGFEKLAWTHRLGPTYGWPLPRPEQWEDTAAAAAAMALPRALGQAAAALGIAEQKDDEGYRLMMRMAKPRRATASGPTWWDDKARIDRLVAYCVKDVEAERALRKLLVPLSAAEREVWLFDQAMNDRGVMIDHTLVRALMQIADQALTRLDKEIAEATGWEVTACSQVSVLTAWLQRQGVDTAKLNKNAIEDLLDGDLPPAARRAVELRKQAAKTSTAKLKAMRLASCRDGRVRGLHLYHGAGTGRWSGKLVQCVTGDHEVLTRDGWKRIEDAVGLMEIMQWDPRTGHMSWALGWIRKFPAPEKLACIDGTAIRGVYTLDHRMPNVKDGFKDWTPRRLLETKRRDGFMVAAPVEQRDSPLTDSQIRLLVATQADGTVKAGRGAYVWRFSKARKIERLRDLLRQTSLPFREIVRTTEAKPVTEFTLPADGVPSWLVKGFGPWVLTLSARQARLAFEELALWDGFRHKRNGSVCLMSPEKEQVEWMATLAALAGVQTTLAWYRDTKSERGRWSLYERQSRTTTLHSKDVSVLENDAPVYCPTVPGGYWLCRYDDRIYITGNTQNMPRGTGTVKNPDSARAWMLRGEAEAVDFLYGPPMYAVSDMLRSCIIASPGHRLLAADYSSIEGRVTAWLAGETWKVEMFRAADRGEGPGAYEATAAKIFNVPADQIKKKGDPRRDVGKVSELALGFAGGVSSFHAFSQVYNVDMRTAYGPLRETTPAETWEAAIESYDRWSKAGVLATDRMPREAWIASEVTKRVWRDLHPATVALWAALVNAASVAVENPGSIASVGPVSYLVRRGFLWARLPSSRCLAYGSPQFMDWPAPWGEKQRALTVLGVDSVTKRWGRYALTPSVNVENQVQAIARDLMANGMLKAEAAGYPIVMTVHDEAVADVPRGHGSLAEYESCLCDLPDWAAGIPLVASGYEAQSYRKD